MSKDVVDLIQRPDIIVPDASPLIHLAQADSLRLLHEIGGTVILVDVVADEVTRDITKPGAAALLSWIKLGQQPGSNTPIRVEATETGRAIALARVTEPTFAMRNGGESAIIEWLTERVDGTNASTIVLYENGRVARVLSRQDMDADIDVVTTRAFLDLAERRGLIPSAADVWQAVEALAPTANPRIQTSSQRRPKLLGRDGETA